MLLEASGARPVPLISDGGYSIPGSVYKTHPSILLKAPFKLPISLSKILVVPVCPNSSFIRCHMLLFSFHQSFFFCLFLSPRFAPDPSSHRSHYVPPYAPCPALAHGCGGRKWRARGGQVLLPVRCLVQQSADGPAALRGKEAPQERGQGAPP